MLLAASIAAQSGAGRDSVSALRSSGIRKTRNVGAVPEMTRKRCCLCGTRDIWHKNSALLAGAMEAWPTRISDELAQVRLRQMEGPS